MRFSPSLLALLLIALSFKPVVGSDKAKKIQLPADPAAAVITMDFEGGLRHAPRPILGPGGRPGLEPKKPFLVVRADGTVLKSGMAGTKLTAKELTALLKFIVQDNRFFDLSQEKIKTAIKEKRAELAKHGIGIATGGLPVDGATTVITVALRDKKHTTKCYFSSLLARQHKDIELIQQMDRIERKLKSIAEKR